MTDEELLAERLKIVERLTYVFRAERRVYLVVTIVSLVVLIAAAIRLFVRGELGPAEITLFCGSGGAISYCASQLLRMWDKALSLVIGR